MPREDMLCGHGTPDRCGSGHTVEFYESDEALVTTLTEYVVGGLRAGEAAVLIATEEHRTAVADAIAAAGVDADDASAAGRLVMLDAEATLAQFMVDGAPDAERFERTIGPVLDRAARDGRPVRAFGEMVALLWADGDVTSTVALEALWGDLAGSYAFSLLCAYPLDGFDGVSATTFLRICDLHDDVLPSEDFPAAGSPADQRRAVAALQHEVRSLRAEVELLRRAAHPGTPPSARPAACEVTRRRRPTTADDRGRRRAADSRLAAIRAEYFEAILVGDGAAAEQVVRSAIAIAEPADVYVEVIAAAMREVGERWAAGALSIANEHVATAITSRVLGSVFDLVLRARSRSGARVLMAAPQGEQHVLGLRMAADLLEGDGHEVVFVGADVPDDALLAMIRDSAPVGLGLTVSELTDPAGVKRLIARARQADPRLQVFVGGQGAAGVAWDAGIRVVGDVRSLEEVSAALADDSRPTARLDGPGGLEPTVAPTPGATVADAVDLLVRSAVESADLVRGHTRHAHELRRAALQDPVTGGWNRRALDDHLRQVGAAADEQPLAVLAIDLDDFKAVNDEAGHEAGDELLRAVARTIEETLRPRDFLARMGGDEFCVVLTRTDIEEARRVGERIREALGANAATSVTRVSIGIAVHGRELRETLARADGAMYAAKRDGGNAVRVAAAA